MRGCLGVAARRVAFRRPPCAGVTERVGAEVRRSARWLPIDFSSPRTRQYPVRDHNGKVTETTLDVHICGQPDTRCAWLRVKQQIPVQPLVMVGCLTTRFDGLPDMRSRVVEYATNTL